VSNTFQTAAQMPFADSAESLDSIYALSAYTLTQEGKRIRVRDR
jgi:hypothetical protein